ncbi:MAG TPA: family 1 glycosylhydrolase, partial [Myxococcota bacterium]|nr:family 1 glycosylhydrolase [Myxococcota bacterium]
MWLALLGCAPVAAPPVSDDPFPDDFLWGAAVAGFQVDMGCPTLPDADCLDARSDWYQWVTSPEITEDPTLFVSGEPLGDGPGMWELFEQDMAQAAADGMTAFRLSLEWSRLFPETAEGVDSVEALDALAAPGAVARYHAMLASVRASGMEPVVTINHYTLPLWVHDGVACHADLETCPARGWVDKERMIRLITLYAGWVAREFGAEVDRWATLNEPFATSASGYLQPGPDRSSPPGRSFDGPSTLTSLEGQIEAHASMYDAVRSWDTVDADGDAEPARVGVVLNMVDIAPADPTREEDVASARHADHLYHRLFLDALTSGSWDDDRDGVFDRLRPDLAHRLDWIGVNYYNAMTVQWLGGLKPLGDLVPAFDFYPTFSWDPHPTGIRAVVAEAATYGLPIVVTENGTPRTDQAEDVLVAHLEHLHEAIDDGADVRGYLYWSWVDNYEWNHGLDLR